MLKVMRLVKEFLGDLKGAVAIIFAVALVMIIGVVGAAVDYSNLSKTRAQAQNMADAAALAGAKARDSGGDPHKAVKDFINANRPSGLSANNETFDVQTDQPGVGLAYHNTMTTKLMSILGISTMSLDIKARASWLQNKYIDFYLLLDISGSMGIGASPADRTIMVNTLNCVFACHFQGDDDKVHAAGAQLRIDALKSAVRNLVDTAYARQVVPEQFRIGIYPFVREMVQLFPLSVDLSGASAATDGLYTDGLTVNAYGAGGTMLETALRQMNQAISNSGNGSQSQPSAVVFFVTDGTTDEQRWDPVEPWFSAPDPFHKIHALNPAVCDDLKNRSILVSVMYIEYQHLDAGTPGNEDDFNGQIAQTNAAIPQIPAALRACASPGMYFQADLPGEINRAMQQMFGAATGTLHLE